MPFSSMPAGSPAAKLWEKIYDASKKAGDSDEIAARKAWSGLKSAGFAKNKEGMWVKEKALAEFSMAITPGASMRWKMTASDTKPDSYGESMTRSLYESFIENSKKPVPEAFASLVTSDFWKGGMPYLSVSHYPDLNGAGVPGMPEKIYIDGEMLKSKGKFYDTKLGRACYKALVADENVPDNKKIRVSIAFLDLAHQHGNGEIFHRNSMEDVCKECEDGVGDKKYLEGYLVHNAMTRVPVNKRASMEVEKSMTTRKQDAESIIDPELAEELENKARLVDKSEVMVEFSEAEDPIEVSEDTEQAKEFVELDPDIAEPEDTQDPVVDEADMGKAKDAQKARSKKYGIAILAQGHVTKPGKWANVPDSQWGDPVNYRYPMPDDAHVRNAASRFGQEKGSYRGKSTVSARISRREKSKGIGAKSMTDPVVTPPDEESKPSGTSMHEDEPMEQDAILAQPIKALIESVVAAKAFVGTDEEKLTAVQPALNALGEAIKAEVAPPKPVDLNQMLLTLSQQVTALTQSNEQLRNDMAIMRSQVTQPKPIVQPTTVVPTPKSASPALVRQLTQKSQATQEKMTPLQEMIYKRAGLTQ